MPKPIRITDARYQAAFAQALLPQSVEALWQAFEQLREHPANLAALGTLPTLPFATDVASVASSQIEGNSIDLNFFMQSKQRGEVAKPKKREFQEIEHLIEAYTFAQTHELNEKNFLRVHALLSKKFLIASKRGAYRDHGMMIQSAGGIEYVAIEAEYLDSAMREFWQDVQGLCATKLTPEAAFYHASLLHLVFVHLHPFSDGNGRSVRILEKWFLAQHLGDWAWRVPSETFYLEYRKDYYAAIKVGVNYYELDYGRCVPFLVMGVKALKNAI